jgi:hypothetical protein
MSVIHHRQNPLDSASPSTIQNILLCGIRKFGMVV